jgi:hypothetical protein
MRQLAMMGLDEYQDLSEKVVFIGLSGGINSAAVLAYIGSVYPEQYRPKKVYAFYSHLIEHSEGTLSFVRECVRYGKRAFKEFSIKVSVGSVNDLFRKQGFIPHPTLSPCTEKLKIIPMMRYKATIEYDIDLVGFVASEKRRIKRQQEKAENPEKIIYPISMYTDEECIELVSRVIGKYPKIYDIKDERGKRVFKHNNCLPCKNMEGNIYMTGEATKQYEDVKTHYPQRYNDAVKVIEDIRERKGKEVYWGRKKKEDKVGEGCKEYVCGF